MLIPIKYIIIKGKKMSLPAQCVKLRFAIETVAILANAV